MAPIKGRRSASNGKNPPAFTHEFVVQNHAEIACCVAVIVVFGLMLRITFPVSLPFVAPQYGRVVGQHKNAEQMHYGTGPMDLCTIVFYCLVCVIFHAAVQQQLLNKICPKLHLSKSKNSKFNESGQLIVFNAISIIWALDIIVKENWFVSISSLWTGYPSHALLISTKYFYIIQFAYWAHIMPELYLQKIKKEDKFRQVKYSVLHLGFVSFLYITNFHRIGIVLLLLHYISGFTKHAVILIGIIEKDEDNKKVQLAQSIYKQLFCIVQFFILILSQTMLWFGLKNHEYTGKLCDFNTPTYKLIFSISSLFIQAGVLYDFFKQNTDILKDYPNLTASFELLKSNRKTVRAAKKRRIAAIRKIKKFISELFKFDQNIQKPLMNGEAKKADKV